MAQGGFGAVIGESSSDQLWGLTLQALLLLGLVLGILVPLVAWAERKQTTLVAGRGGFAGTPLGGIRLADWVRPLADGLKLLGKRDKIPRPSARGIQGWVPLLIVLAPLLGFAAIPWSGHYEFGETSVSVVLADVEAGVLFIFALAGLGALATVWAGLAGNKRARLAALRSAGLGLSGDLALFFAVLPMLLIFGSLSLAEMARGQDSSFALLGFWSALSPTSGGLVASGPTWPAWGIFLNPPAFILFLTAGSVRLGLPPFHGEHADPEIAGGTRSDYAGLSLGLFFLAARLQTLLFSALVVLIFFGGWTIPWLSQTTLVDAISRWVGGGVANAICLGVHLASFFFKLFGVVCLQLMIRSSLPRPSYERAMDLCWKIVVPAALIDLMLTAGALHFIGGSGG
jgi:NADH-quinone oxidoreductase subunit H